MITSHTFQWRPFSILAKWERYIRRGTYGRRNGQGKNITPVVQHRLRRLKIVWNIRVAIFELSVNVGSSLDGISPVSFCRDGVTSSSYRLVDYWFSSLSSRHLCIFDSCGAMYIVIFLVTSVSLPICEWYLTEMRKFLSSRVLKTAAQCTRSCDGSAAMFVQHPL